MIYFKNTDSKYFVVISLVIFVMQVIHSYFIGFLNLLMLKLLFVSVAIVLGIFILFIKLKLSRIFFCVVLFIQMFVISGCLVSLNYLKTHSNWSWEEFTEPAYYLRAKKQIYCRECIKHFPKFISDDAKNVEFYQYNDYFHGSEGMFLKFETNFDIIKNEIKNHKYSKMEGPFINNEMYSCCLKNSIRFKNNFLDKTGYTFYIIKNKNHFFQHFPLEYGLAVKGNTILYYYSRPD